MSEMRMDCCLDLMRRLPPQKCEQHLIGLIELAPDLCENLLSTVDQPLKVAKDKSNGKEYLICDYNRDGDSFRSPWTNTYDPPLEDGIVPSEKLRHLEIDVNAAFDSYRELYFEGGISSAYFWDIENGFAGVILIKKESDGQRAVKGCWDSIHVIEVNEKSLKAQKNAKYKLVSTVMLWLEHHKESTGVMNLGGSLSRQTESDCAVNEQTPHLVNIGRMIEDAESKMRSTLNEVYFGKAKQIVAGLRSVESSDTLQTREELVDDLKKAVTHKRPNNSVVKEEA